MANKDILQITFNADTADFEKQLLSSMESIGEEVSDKLSEAFAKAGKNPKVKKQLTGVYQGLFDELSEAAGEVDKVNIAIDRFAGKIDYIYKVGRTKKIEGLFDNLSVGNVDKLLEKYDEVIEKEKEIERLSSNAFRDEQKNKTAIKSLQEIQEVYGDASKSQKKYNEKLSTYIKNAGIEVSTVEKEIDAYSSLIALYEKVNTTKVTSGSVDAIRKQQALLYLMKEIQQIESGAVLFSNFRNKELIDVNGLRVPIATLTQQLEGAITTMANSLIKNIKKEMSEIFEAVGNEAVKMSNHQAKIAARTQAKVKNAMGAGDGSGGGSETGIGDGAGEYDYDEHNNIFAKYFDTAKKSAEELEDLFSEVESNLDRLYQLAENDELNSEQLKEYVALYKQLEDLTGKVDEFSIHSDYTDYFNTLVDSNKQLEKYADKLEKIREKGYLKSAAGTGSEDIDDSKIEELKKEITEVKEDITSLKGRVDNLEDTTAFDALTSQVEGFDEKIRTVDGSVENLVNSFKLLSELSLTDLQKVAIPFFNGINQVYDKNNGNHISGYWDALKEEIESSNIELRELLKLVGLYNSRIDGLKLISDGMVNSGGLIGDNRVLIARKNTNDRFEQTQALKNALNEAYNAGVNVSRILDVIGTKESNVFLEVQETAKGNILGNIYGQLDEDFVNPEWFEATDEQIKKLISDMITLQRMGINVESNLTNIMYDKERGFSFIDMDLDITKFENDAELMEDHMMRIFGDLEDFYLDKNDSVNSNIVQKIRERFENLSEQVQQAYAEAQDSHSPSKEFEKLENDAVDGIVKGANDNKERLKNVGKQMADNIKAGFKEGMSEIDGVTSLSGDQNPVLSGSNSIKDEIEKLENDVKSDAGTGLIQSILFGEDGHIKMPSTLLSEIDDIQREIDARLSKNVNADITDLVDNKSKLITASVLNGMLSFDDVSKYMNHPDMVYSEADRLGLSNISSQYENIDETVTALSELITKVRELNSLQTAELPNQTEVLSGDTTAIEVQDKLESKVEETTSSLEEQEKVVKRILYHWGNFNSGKVGESFNEMITSYFNGLNDKKAKSPYGAFGTGVYSISNPERFTSIDTSTEDPLRKFMAIDASNLKMYETKTEEHATALFNFLTKLQQMCINLATGFDYDGKFDASTVSVDGIYQEAKNLFANMDMTYEQYIEFINHMQELVKKSGLGTGKVIRPNGEGKDNIATKFMRALGYQGIDNTGTSYDSFTHGSVIFDKPDISMVTKWDTAAEAVEHYNQNVKTAIQLTEQESNQTPLSFFENESGQLTIFDGIEEQQQKVEESVKETNQAIEGQIDLFQHLNSLENNVETNVDNTSDMNHITTSAEEAAQAKKDFADANEAVQDSVDDSKSKLELETELMERLAAAARMAADAKKEFVDANKMVEESTKKSSDVMQEEKKDVDDESKSSRKNNFYDKYKNIFDQLKSQSGSKIQEFSKQLDIIAPKLERLKQLESIDVDVISDVEKQELSDLTTEVNKLLSSLDSKEGKRKYNLAEQSVINNLSGQISDFLNKNTAASKEMQNRLESLRIELKQLGLSEADVDRIRTAFAQLKAEMKETGQTGAAFGDKIRKKFQDVAAYFATYVSIYDFINAIKQGYQYVLEIDKQMIELEKVSNSTGQRLEESFEHAKFAAKDLGSTISDVISATADWARMGYNADAAEQLAEVAIIYKNVGDGIDIDTANESLISTLQGFQLEADEAMRIVDVYNEVANTQAISSAGLGEALKRSAASFNAANTSLEKSVALVTATNEVIQNPESVGTLWKTMSARIRGASTELAELSEETDEYTKSSSKLRDLVKGLTGFDIMLDENTFKDIYDIILGIGKEWDKLTDVEQASLGEALAGKRNANALYAVLGNLETLEEAYKSAEGAAGSALKEQEKWEQGLEARTNKLKASLEELSTVFLESDFLGGLIDLGTRAIEVFSKLIDTLGVIPTLLTATGSIGAFKLFKNDGKPGIEICKEVSEYHVNMPSMI